MKIFRFVIAIYFWLMSSVVTVIGSSTIAVMRFFYWIFGKPANEYFGHSVSTCWAKLVFRLNPIWSLKVVGDELIPRSEPLVIVANHQSMTDIWVIYFLNLQFRWLSKHVLFKVPCVGPGMKWSGYIPVIRGNPESHKSALERSAKVLESGVSMFFFPEGTRSLTGEMRPFKVGAFKLAREKNVAVLPIVINGAKDLLPKGSALPGAAHVTLTVLAPRKVPDTQPLESFSEELRNEMMQIYTQSGHKQTAL